jgi:regulator of replication initiation timing
MEQDVALQQMEAGLSWKKLNDIDTRLSGVESTLKDLIENNEEMKEELKDKLSEVKLEMEKNTSQVKRLQRNYQRHQWNARYLFCAMLSMLVLWTILMNWYAGRI